MSKSQLEPQPWKEGDGDIMPSYESGPNAPEYPGVNHSDNLTSLEETHGAPVASLDVDPSRIIAVARARIASNGKPSNTYKGATSRYIRNRRDVLGE